MENLMENIYEKNDGDANKFIKKELIYNLGLIYLIELYSTGIHSCLLVETTEQSGQPRQQI